MMAEPFATGHDLQLLAPGTPDETAWLIVNMVSDGIRAGCRWGIDEFTSTEVIPVHGFRHWPELHEPEHIHRHGHHHRKIMLPARHVTDTTVTVGATELTVVTDYTVNMDEGTILLASVPSDTVTVEYTAGWKQADRPSMFRTVCIEWAVQYAANPTNVRSYTLGKVQESFAAATTTTVGSSLVIEDPRLSAYALEPF